MYCNEANSIYSIEIKIPTAQINYNHRVRRPVFLFLIDLLAPARIEEIQFLNFSTKLYISYIPHSFLFLPRSYLRGRIKPKLMQPLAIREQKKETTIRWDIILKPFDKNQWELELFSFSFFSQIRLRQGFYNIADQSLGPVSLSLSWFYKYASLYLRFRSSTMRI